MALDRKGQRHNLFQNKPDTAVWLLGVNIAANGNYSTELSILKARQEQYSTFLQHTPMTR